MMVSKMMKVFSFVLTLVMICSLVFVFADINDVHAEGEEAYAILYKDGEMVFQRGDTPDEGREVLAIYTGFETIAYADDNVPWDSNRTKITTITVKDEIAPISMEYWFMDCTNLTTADVSKIDTSNVTSMRSLFNRCNALTSVNASGWNTSNVTSMRCMFQSCTSLQTLDVSGWDTSNVVYMEYLFYLDGVLQNLDLSGWDTSNVTDMSYMFGGCSALQTLDISRFDTSKVTTMYYMFTNCDTLRQITLGENFNFKGNNITTTSNQALLPNPSSYPASSTGKWIVEGADSSTAMTSEQMRNAGTVTPGTWVHDAATDYSGAILYSDGELVFQNDCEDVDPNRTVLSKYPARGAKGFLTSTYTSSSSVPWYSLRNSITSVTFKDAMSPVSTAYWFYGCANLTAEGLDLSGLNTSNVTNMSYMFYDCSNLDSLDLSDLNTSNVTNMQYMFYGCSKLQTLDVSDWNTSKVTNMPYMFYNCGSLESLNISGWDTARVTNMSYMFSNCNALRQITLGSSFNFKGNNISTVSNQGLLPKPTAYPYDGKWVLQGADDSTAMSPVEMRDVGTVTPGTWIWHEDTTAGCAILYDDGELVFQLTDEADPNRTVVGKYGGFLTSYYTSDSTAPWYGDRNKIKSVSFKEEMSPVSTACWFYGCSNLIDVDSNNLNTVNVTDMSSMFYGCGSLQDLDVSNYNTSNVTDMRFMFYNCDDLSVLDLSRWDTSNVTDMQYMFYYCNKLASLDISDWDTSNVTNMQYMFYYCSSLQDLDVSDWDTSNVTTMYDMFYNCSKLESLNLAGWNTSEVTNMEGMFRGCSSLNTLDASGWDTSSVTDMQYLFYGCSKLKNLNISDWDTSKVTTMYYMFNDCSALQSLDLSGWDTSSATSLGYMFNNCTTLREVTLGENFNFKGKNISSTSSQAILPNPSSSYPISSTGKWVRQGADSSTAMTSEQMRNAGTVTPGTWVHDAVTDYSGAILYEDGELVFQDNCEDVDEGRTVLAKYPARGTNGFLTTNYTSYSSVPWYSLRNSIKSVTVTMDMSPVSVQYWFYGCSNLVTADLGKVNTSRVTDMSYMFGGCSSLQTLDISGFDTSNVTDMYYMFTGCNKLSSVTFGDNFNFKGKNITYAGYQAVLPTASSTTGPATGKWILDGVAGATAMTAEQLRTAGKITAGTWVAETVDDKGVAILYSDGELVFQMSNEADEGRTVVGKYGGILTTAYNTNNKPLWNSHSSSITSVTFKDEMAPVSLAFWFYNCSNLTSIDMEKLDTSNVTSMVSMFSGCSKLESVDVSGWNTAKVTDMSSLFYGCSKLQSLDLSAFNTARVSTMTNVFYKCSSLETLDISSWNTSAATNMAGMFSSCTKLHEVMLGSTFNFRGRNITDVSKQAILPQGFSSSHYATGKWIIEGADRSTALTPAEMRTAGTVTAGKWIPDVEDAHETAILYSDGELVFQLTDEVDPNRTVVGKYSEFLTSTYIDVNYAPWYRDRAKIKTVTIKDEMAPVSTAYWFYGCSSLTTANLAKLDTSNVTNMQYMFSGCSGLTTLNLSSFDTSGVTNMRYMFNGCSKLTTLRLSGWNTSNVTNMEYMFNNCSGFTTLNLSNLNTSSVTNMQYMFSGCSKLTNLNLSNWNTSNVTNMSHMFSAPMSTSSTTYMSLTKIDGIAGFDTSNVTNMQYMFYRCNALPLLDVSNWNTGKVTDMQYMFYNCSKLGSLDVSSWDTSSVTNMQSMFYYCSLLQNLDVSSWDISNVTTMYYMFYYCHALQGLDVSNWNTGKVTNMQYLFYYCDALSSLDVSDWNTSNVTNMYGTFGYCSSLQDLDVSEWDTSKVTNMSYMFYNCSSLPSIDISDWDTSKVTSMLSMFAGCSKIQTLDLLDLNISNVTNMSSVFSGCSSLQDLDLSTWNTSKVTTMYYMFNDCSALQTLDLTNFNTSNVGNMQYMFNNCNALMEITLGSNFNFKGKNITTESYQALLPSMSASTGYPATTGKWSLLGGDSSTAMTSEEMRNAGTVTPGTWVRYIDYSGAILYSDGELVFQNNCEDVDPNRTVLAKYPANGTNGFLTATYTSSGSAPWSGYRNRITSVTVKDEFSPVSTAFWFYGCSNLTTVDLAELNMSNVTDMSYMFYGCNKLDSLDFSGLNTPNVTNMQYMFSNCSNLHSLDLSGLNTSSVTNMQYMFSGCIALEELDVSGWDTSKVSNMNSMFNNCNKLESLDLSDWNTSGVTNMQDMFYNCSSLQDLDVSNWNTSNVTTMYQMFDNCSSLQNLDLSSFNTPNVTNMNQMFYGCRSLETLDIIGFDTSKVTTMYQMLSDCGALRQITLGSNFNFKGNNITSTSYQAILPLPSSTDVTLNTSYAHTPNVGDDGVQDGYYANSLQDKQVVTIPGATKLHVKITYQTYNSYDVVYVIPGNYAGSISSYSGSYGQTARLYGSRTTREYDITGDTVTFGFYSNYSGQGYGYYAVVTGIKTTYFPYSGKWMLQGGDSSTAMTPTEMRNAGTVTPGVWVLAMDDDQAMIKFNADGGYVSPDVVLVTSEDLANGVTLPEATRLHYFFDGWYLSDNEDTVYPAGTTIPANVISIGQNNELHAKWSPDPSRVYRVMHYQQNASLYGYSLVETETFTGDVNTEVSPEVKQYDGFVTPDVQTVTVLDDDSLVVSYYYDRVVYEVAYDGNGADGGFMSNQQMVSGISYNLYDNVFYKSGSIFTGWNTEPDGTGVAYTDEASVLNLTDVTGSVITLYAQWIENPNEPLEPTAGKVTVTGKAGQTIVIPDLPAGTTYEINEVLDSDVWTFDGMENGTGEIVANSTMRAGVGNSYHAEGTVPLVIYKSVLDGVTREPTGDYEAGQFSFRLQKYNSYNWGGGYWNTLETAYNEVPDMNETTLNDDDEIIDNPRYLQAPVYFSSLNFTQSDIGKTYEYRILEDYPSGNYSYQNREIYFTVTVNDAGRGMLDFDIQFRDDIDTITNIKYPGGDSGSGYLMFEKSVVGTYPEDSEFSFNVRLYDDNNHDYDGQVYYVVGTGNILGDAQMIREGVWQNGTPITIGVNQFVLLQGAPVGMNYEITEVEQDGWLLLQSSKATGKCVAVNSEQDVINFVNNPARFINGFQADGSLNLKATKEMVGRSLDYGEFTFVIEDEDGNIISRGENDADGKIAFEPIPYTNDDVGNTYAYTVREVIPDYQAGGVTYSDTVYDITVDVVLEKGVLKAVPSENAQNMVFTNTYTAADTSITLNGNKVVAGRALKDSDKWTFTISGDGPLPAEPSVEVTPLNDDTFSFTIPFTQADLDGESEKTFTYTISESGFVPFVKNDSSKTVTIRLSDDGEGNLRAEVLRASSDDLTFVNHANVLLPATGSMTAILVSIAGIALMAAGFVFYRKRRGTNAA